MLLTVAGDPCGEDVAGKFSCPSLRGDKGQRGSDAEMIKKKQPNQRAKSSSTFPRRRRRRRKKHKNVERRGAAAIAAATDGPSGEKPLCWWTGADVCRCQRNFLWNTALPPRTPTYLQPSLNACHGRYFTLAGERLRPRALTSKNKINR